MKTPPIFRYANISREDACQLYHRFYRLWYSIAYGYFVYSEFGTEDTLPEDATPWPPTVELSPSEMQHYLDELTG